MLFLSLREELSRCIVSMSHRGDSPLLPAAAHFAVLLCGHAHYFGQEPPELAIQHDSSPFTVSIKARWSDLRHFSRLDLGRIGASMR
jgi:hypothetical protein